ncbi:zinc finger protein 501-like isoform X2, partial [Biomphalaria glabrata]
SSEEQNPSMLDDIKQDFTNDLKNAINIEKIEFILHSETPQIISIGHTIEQSLAEETQKKKVNQIQEMTLNQDLYAENTSKKDWYVGSTSKKDLYAGSLKDEGHVSYYNRTHQLVNAEEKAGLLQMGTETISSSFKANKCKMIPSHKKTFKSELCQKEFHQSDRLKSHELLHSERIQSVSSFKIPSAYTFWYKAI